MHHSIQGKTAFNYSSDMSGDVQIMNEAGMELWVPGRDLLGFVAEWVAGQRISAIEQMAVHELLGIAESDIPDIDEDPLARSKRNEIDETD